ncbi:hypothetical protein B0H11DRAFT_1939793 [Mycena galericulata]|nr:hypothetical protein B0H11DRAFT_1939793 [Mycena galericulata]
MPRIASWASSTVRLGLALAAHAEADSHRRRGAPLRIRLYQREGRDIPTHSVGCPVIGRRRSLKERARFGCMCLPAALRLEVRLFKPKRAAGIDAGLIPGFSNSQIFWRTGSVRDTPPSNCAPRKASTASGFPTYLSLPYLVTIQAEVGFDSLLVYYTTRNFFLVLFFWPSAFFVGLPFVAIVCAVDTQKKVHRFENSGRGWGSTPRWCTARPQQSFFALAHARDQEFISLTSPEFEALKIHSVPYKFEEKILMSGTRRLPMSPTSHADGVGVRLPAGA